MTHPKEAPHAGHGCCGAHRDQHSEDHKPQLFTDPVCGMTVDPATTPHHAVHDGHDYHFCSVGCQTKFMADPDRYLGTKSADPIAVAPGTLWTCPMHPEVRRSEEHTSELQSLI